MYEPADPPTVVTFGKGEIVVSKGKYQDKPAIFIEPAVTVGIPGEFVLEEEKWQYPQNSLRKGAVVLQCENSSFDLEILVQHINELIDDEGNQDEN